METAILDWLQWGFLGLRKENFSKSSTILVPSSSWPAQNRGALSSHNEMNYHLISARGELLVYVASFGSSIVFPLTPHKRIWSHKRKMSVKLQLRHPCDSSCCICSS